MSQPTRPPMRPPTPEPRGGLYPAERTRGCTRASKAAPAPQGRTCFGETHSAEQRVPC